MKFRLVVPSTLVFVLSAIALPASADVQAPRPTTTIIPIDMKIVDHTCPFPLDEHISGKQVTTDFFDASGQLESRLRHIIVRATLINQASGTVVMGVHEALTVDRDLTGTVTRHGLRLIVTVPGMGTVLLDAGTFVTDVGGKVVFEAGPHQFLRGDVIEFCEALS